MTSELQVKEVNFNGDQLFAAQDKDGIIYVGVSHICNGLGFTKHQKDRQIMNVQKDEVLRRGCLKFEAGVFDANNITIAIMINFLPLWLAKISITPAMKKDNPVLVEKLIDYQIKARDVLAAAFLPEETKTLNPYNLLLKNINDNQRLLVVEQSKLNDKLTQHIETYTEEKESFNQTNLLIGYEIEGLKQQVNKEIVARTSYIPIRPLVAKKVNVLNRVREVMLKKWVENAKQQETKIEYTKRINNIIDNMVQEKWTISDFKTQFDRQERMYAGDDALIHEIGLMAYKYYTGCRID